MLNKPIYFINLRNTISLGFSLWEWKLFSCIEVRFSKSNRNPSEGEIEFFLKTKRDVFASCPLGLVQGLRLASRRRSLPSYISRLLYFRTRLGDFYLAHSLAYYLTGVQFILSIKIRIQLNIWPNSNFPRFTIFLNYKWQLMPLSVVVNQLKRKY